MKRADCTRRPGLIAAHERCDPAGFYRPEALARMIAKGIEAPEEAAFLTEATNFCRQCTNVHE
jgi:hypothetical protein